MTGSQDGVVKIWEGINKKYQTSIKVSKYAVTALAFMTLSKRLVVATMDRMISFYEVNASKQKSPLISRIEDLFAIPLCLDYVRHP